MSLPHFKQDNLLKNIVPITPIYSKLFEVESENLKEDIIDLIIDYKINTLDKTLQINFNTSEETIKYFKKGGIITNKLNIKLHDRKGKVFRIFKFYFYDECNYIYNGSYEDLDLLKISCIWKYDKIEVIDEEK